MQPVADLGMDRRIAHDPAPADPRAPRLELRLDQRGEPGPRRQQGQDRRQDEAQGDEADIDGTEIRRDRDGVAVEAARIPAFEVGDAGIIPQRRVELVAPDIDGVDMGGAPRQQRVGEAPVEAPTSRQTRPAGSNPKASRAATSLRPPRET